MTKGISDTSMEQIAEAVPVSKMTLYNIFGSKEGLLEAVMDGIIEENVSAFDKAVQEAKDPVDALNKIAVIRGLESEMTPEFLMDLQRYPDQLDRMMRIGTEMVIPKFHQIILEGQQQGYIRQDLSPIVIISFLQSMKEYLAKSGSLSGAGSLETVSQQLTTIFYHGIMENKSNPKSAG